MKHRSVSMCYERFKRFSITVLIIVCTLMQFHAAQAAPMTSEDIPSVNEAGPAGTNTKVSPLSESLELLVEDINQNALEGATVDILYSGAVVGSGVTPSDGRITFTGLTASVSFKIFASHEEAGELMLEYDGAESGFDETVVLTLPRAVTVKQIGRLERLMAGYGSTAAKIIVAILLILAVLFIRRILVNLARRVLEKRRVRKRVLLQIERHIERLGSGSIMPEYDDETSE